MTPKEKYIKALQDLIKAQKEVEKEQENPFNLGLPTHLGLSEQTFITDDELQNLDQILDQSINDNSKFARVWNLGSDILIKAKALLL